MDRNNYLVSVIITVFNNAEALPKCLDSVLNQNYINIEVILINDGSTDDSDLICLEYSKRDNRIRYVKQENKGVASARNLGCSMANGLFICNFDSDDYVSEDYIAALCKAQATNKADIVEGKMTLVYQNGEKKEIHPNTYVQLDTDDFLNNCARYKGAFSSLATKLIRTKLIKNNLANEDIGLSEDYEQTCRILAEDLKYCITNEGTYYYVQTKNSRSRFEFNQNKFKLFETLEEVIRMQKAKGFKKAPSGNSYRIIKHCRIFAKELIKSGLKTRFKYYILIDKYIIKHTLPSLKYYGFKRKLTTILRSLILIINKRLYFLIFKS